jgi:GH15 family glucan-1,4-alpha-glucosidase
MSLANKFYQPVSDKQSVINAVYQKSCDVIRKSQIATGGTTASMKGSRYAGYVYPRDHAYTTRAFISAGMETEAKQALTYILNVELSEEGVMYQRYNSEQQSTSNKPPQIDGNAQTIIALGDYFRKTADGEFVERYKDHILTLEKGLQHHTHVFAKGDLVFSINGIIEFSPFEEGFEIYTNACVVKAYRTLAELWRTALNDEYRATEFEDKAERIRNGIKEYLYIPEYGGFMACIRREPNPSVVTIANLKSFLTLADFDIFEATDPMMQESLTFHLEGTKNEEIGGYNRYADGIGRHNFGNGPWPMVMMRLVDYYVKSGNMIEANKQLDWVLNVALLNLDVKLGLPEHVVTKEELLKEFHGFMRTFDVNPREERVGEYEKNERGEMVKKYGVAYPINPLVWSHSMFILVWDRIKDQITLK